MIFEIHLILVEYVEYFSFLLLIKFIFKSEGGFPTGWPVFLPNAALLTVSYSQFDKFSPTDLILPGCVWSLSSSISSGNNVDTGPYG